MLLHQPSSLCIPCTPRPSVRHLHELFQVFFRHVLQHLVAVKSIVDQMLTICHVIYLLDPGDEAFEPTFDYGIGLCICQICAVSGGFRTLVGHSLGLLLPVQHGVDARSTLIAGVCSWSHSQEFQCSRCFRSSETIRGLRLCTLSDLCRGPVERCHASLSLRGGCLWALALLSL